MTLAEELMEFQNAGMMQGPPGHDNSGDLEFDHD